MATTTSSTTKSKLENNNLTRTKSLGRKPKQPSSVSSEDGSEQKPEKPLPNYLKPTISSRPDQARLLKKNLEDNQKLLRRRSFDRPPSSLTSPSTSSTRIQKTLNVSPSRPRDRPTVPREKPATALRSSSFHGTRGVPRGGTSVKSSPVAPKKSGLSSGSTSLKSKKEGPEHVTAKKLAPEKEIALDTASLSSAQEDEEEVLKVESDVQVVGDDIEQPKEEKENKEVHVEVVVHADTSGEENENGGSTLVAPVEEVIVVAKENEEEEEEEEEERLINEHNSEEKEQENNQENKVELAEEVTTKIDEDETSEKVDLDMNSRSLEETTEVKEEEVNKEENEKVKDEEQDKVKEEESGDVKKKEVVKGKKESPSAYNDVIASKMQENPRKNKVLALAGAFQTVIDYETAASK